MLWTDAGSREFIATQYPWFLDTFDNYTYNIERADAIRYFVLHHYGGIYVDLDIGCLRPMDQLLVYPVILPVTTPVGISNDLIFSEKGHPFMEQTIHNLVTFDHDWILNYPTVMFSTGPMFLSIQYGLFTSSHSLGDPIRVLPRSLYGKNAKEGEAPHSFFSHFYGSSWHADDAAFMAFLLHWGKGLMWIGLGILILGIIRIAIPSKQRRYSLRRIGGYDVLLPRWHQRSGRWQLSLGWSTFLAADTPQSPNPDDSSDEESDDTIISLPFDSRPSSPASSEMSSSADYFSPAPGRHSSNPVLDAVRRVRNRVASLAGAREEAPRTPVRSRRQRYSRGVLFFLPAIFAQTPDIELASHRDEEPLPPPSYQRTIYRGGSSSQPFPPEKQRYADDLERAGIYGDDFPAESSPQGSSGQYAHSIPERNGALVDLSDIPRSPGSHSRPGSRSMSRSRLS